MSLCRAKPSFVGAAQRLGIVIAMVFGSLSAHAAAGWTDFGTISMLNQQPSLGNAPDMVFFNLSVSTSPSGCSVSTQFYFSVTTDTQKRLFAMLLAAHAAGQSVQVWVTGNCLPLWGSTEIDGLVIQ
jgi:hypothetical protein